LGTQIDDKQSRKKHLDADLGDLSTTLNREKPSLPRDNTIEDGQQNRRRRLNGADKGTDDAARHDDFAVIILTNSEKRGKEKKRKRVSRALLKRVPEMETSVLRQ